LRQLIRQLKSLWAVGSRDTLLCTAHEYNQGKARDGFLDHSTVPSASHCPGYRSAATNRSHSDFLSLHFIRLRSGFGPIIRETQYARLRVDLLAERAARLSPRCRGDLRGFLAACTTV